MQKEQFSAPVVHPATTKVALTVNEFLSIANIGRTKFYAEVKAGRIKVLKLGTKTLVPATEPAAWLARLPQKAV